MAEERTDRPTTDLGSARRRRSMRVERGSTQALLIAAIPLLVLLVIVILGAWVMQGQNRKEQAAVSTPTHLPTLKPATLVAVSEATATPTSVAAAQEPTEVEAEATATSEPTATDEPTATTEPEATATPEVDPDALVAGVTAEVSGTAGQGLRIRAVAGLSGASVKIVPEGTVLTILGGPESVDDYDWYQVRDETGTEGWVAGNWIVRSK